MEKTKSMSDQKQKIRKKRMISIIAFLSGVYFFMRFGCKKYAESEKINEENPYIDFNHIKIRSGQDNRIPTVYERKIKPAIDRILSFVALILLSPLFGLISIVIYMDDPGPVFFTQKRVGKGKAFFNLHKFRSMKMSTPHDVPTHQLEHPEQYITKVGRVLRKTSLDELPQIWDIFRGKMSVIGPRPALWNQEDLVAEREKYGANDILPGLTGLAQIKGRDELLIPEKARLDGEYVQSLKQGGIQAFLFDGKLFFGTIRSVLCHDGVIEGGTGVIKEANISEAGFEDYGCDKHFDIDKNRCIKILITGSGSYVGTSLLQYSAEHYPNLEIDTVDMLDGSWKEKCFGVYDTVFHVAGIAHADVGNVSPEDQKKYYEVNRDLAVEVCRKCKKEGVKQFIFMSSMIVYGESAPLGKKKMIDRYTVPAPANFYGDSKWQGDMAVRKLQNDEFRVAVLRPPMIYGKRSRGNYPILSQLAHRLPVFPEVNNERSMLYIENLCEFVAQLALSGEGGIYFPQNGEYGKTSEIVRMIGEGAGRRVWKTRILLPAIKVAGHIPAKIGRLVNKAFGNMVYDQRLSRYDGLDYQKVSLEESIKKIEEDDKVSDIDHKSVLILVNHDVVIYNFRLELVQRLLSDGYEVHISSPVGEHTRELVNLGAHFHEIIIDRHGTNPIADLRILNEYKRLIRSIKPIIVLTYTVKCNVYGGIAAKIERVPFLANITGLGTMVNGGGVKGWFVLALYKIGLKGAQKVFFQNEENKEFMVKHGVVSAPCFVLPGSGVNLNKHCFEPYPEEKEKLIFTTIGRIMKDKGIDELIEASKVIKRKYPNVTFRLIGFFDDNYEAIIRKTVNDGNIVYVQQQSDIHPWIKESHAIVHPSYHEGMSNVLLEAASTGRPVLVSDIPGCREAVDEAVSGLCFEPKNSAAIVQALEHFINMPYEQKALMGSASRKKMEREFNRDVVVEKYMNEIQSI